MAVITMSRQVGSGAEELANQLCQELGVVAFDKRLMMSVASDVGLSEGEIVDYSEEQYERRNFFEALLGRRRPVAETAMWVGGGEEGYERQVRGLDEDRAIDLIRATVQAAYGWGNVLIVGRGGQTILEDKPDVLHVRVVAPFEERVWRVRKQAASGKVPKGLGNSEGVTAPQARRFIQERDQASAEYLRTFHHIDADDPTLYHLVLNTGKLTIDKCVELIQAAVAGVAETQSESPAK